MSRGSQLALVAVVLSAVALLLALAPIFMPVKHKPSLLKIDGVVVNAEEYVECIEQKRPHSDCLQLSKASK